MARSYKNYDFLRFKNLIGTHNWDAICNMLCPNAMWSEILNIIKTYLDAMCPMKKMILPVYTPEWLTPVIIDCMRIRDNLYKKARRTMTNNDWLIANFHKRNVEKLIFNSRKTKIGSLLEHRKDDPVKFWEGIRKLLPTKQPPH